MFAKIGDLMSNKTSSEKSLTFTNDHSFGWDIRDPKFLLLSQNLTNDMFLC